MIFLGGGGKGNIVFEASLCLIYEKSEFVANFIKTKSLQNNTQLLKHINLKSRIQNSHTRFFKQQSKILKYNILKYVQYI